MKKSSDFLFRLIKSLDANEKRFFIIYSQRHKSGERNKSVKLFRIIENQKSYSEADIKKAFNYTPFVKQLNKAKAYLTHSILKSLALYDSEQSILAKINSHQEFAEVLCRKKHFTEALKEIKKGKALASLNEHFEQWMELINREREIIQSIYPTSFHEKIHIINEEEKQVIEKFNNLYLFKQNHSKVLFLTNGQLVKDKTQVDQLKKLIENKPLNNEKDALSVSAKAIYYRIHNSYYFAIRNFSKAHEHLREYLSLFESNPFLIKKNPVLYFSTLKNCLVICFFLKKDNEAAEIIEKMKLIPVLYDIKKEPDLQINIFQTVSSFEINTINSNGNFKEGLLLIKTILENLEKFESKIPDTGRFLLYYYIARVYLGAEKHKEALLWINKIIFSEDKNTRGDLLSMTVLLKLIIHLDMHDYLIDESIVKSTYRNLYRKQRLYKFETALLHFLRLKAPKIYSSKDYIENLMIFKKEIEEILLDPLEAKVLNDFDIISWLDSKITKRSFAEVVQEKANKIRH